MLSGLKKKKLNTNLMFQQDEHIRPPFQMELGNDGGLYEHICRSFYDEVVDEQRNAKCLQSQDK